MMKFALLTFLAVTAFYSKTSYSREAQHRVAPHERYQGRMIVFTKGEKLSPEEIDYYQTEAAKLGREVVFQEGGGFVGGGGGTGVSKNQKLLFLDLFQFDESFADQEHSSKGSRLVLDSSDLKTNKSESFEIPLFDNSGKSYDHIILESNPIISNEDFKNSAPFRYARKALESYGIALSLPASLIDNISWHFTDNTPISQSRLSAEELDANLSLETIAYFHGAPKNYKRQVKVIISIPRWNKLGFFGQAALIIHEALRNYQLSHNNPDLKHNFLEIDLQRATAIATLCQPNFYLDRYLLILLSPYNGFAGGVDGLGASITHQRAKDSCLRVDQ